MRESKACLEVAGAWGYLGSIEPELERKIDHVIGTLVRLVFAPQ